MSNYDELIGILKDLLFNRYLPQPQIIKGLLGDGTGVVRVPGRKDFNYARFNRGSTKSFEVFNKTVPEVDGWPILLSEFPWQPGLIQVVGTDWEAYIQSGWGDSVSTANPHAPTHVWRDGYIGSDPLSIYMRAIAPARAYSPNPTGTVVFVNSFEYHTGTLWPGTPGIDLGPLMSSIPTGTARFAGVYVNPNNTLGVVTGATSVDTQAFDPPLVTFPFGTIPIARVRLYGGQGGLKEADFRDARRLFDLPPTGTAGDAVDSVFGRTGAVVAVAGDYSADLVDYDNATSGLTATDVQAAIDEIDGRLDNLAADEVSYDNSTSGLTATDVQAAIDELETMIGGGGGVGVNLLADTLTYDSSWQVNTTFNDIADDTYGPTLWNCLNSADPPDIIGFPGTTGDPFTRYFELTFDGTTKAGIVQFVEAQLTKALRGQPVSLSVDAWGTDVSAFRMNVLYFTGTADSLTSDVVSDWTASNPTLATGWNYIGTPAAISIDGTRTRYEVENLTIPSSANNLGIFLWTGTQASGNVWNLARAKLEPGTTATDYIPFTPKQELDRTNYHLRKYTDVRTAEEQGFTADQVSFILDKNFQMRTTPSGSFQGTANTDYFVETKAGVAQTGFTFSLAITAGNVIVVCNKTSHGLTQNTNRFRMTSSGVIIASARL